MKLRAIGAALGLCVMLGAAALTSGCSRHKQEAIILANRGDQIVELDPNGAIQAYEQAVQLDPSNHLILYKLAKAYKKKEEWDKVASTLARATELAPQFANYWKERGWALTMQARKGTISFDDAKESYTKCVEYDQNQDECYEQLAVAYLETDDEQKALANFTKAIEKRPTAIRPYHRLANLYLNLFYEKEAEQVLNAAIKLGDPKDKEMYHVHNLLAEVYRDRGDIAKMVSEFEAAHAIDKSDPSALFNLGMGYSKLDGKKAEALQMLKGFTARACKGANAVKFKAHCNQAQDTMRKLKGPGS